MSKICDDLRAAILQAATQGKLTEQRPEDGSASDLLEEIKAKKEKLITEGTIKKQKALALITEEEIPFNIPENWKWVRLDDLVVKDIRRGKPPVYSENGTKFAFAQKCNTKHHGIDLSLAKAISKDSEKKYSNEDSIKAADIIINSTGTGTLGRVGYIDLDISIPSSYYPDSHVTIVRTLVSISRYVFVVLKNTEKFLEEKGEGSTKQKELKPLTIQNLLIPLPPLAEQKRIVKKVDELMDRVADLEQSADVLASLKKAFPDDIKASLLQYAMQGKLTKQLPEDGNSEDLLEEIRAEKEKLVAEGKIKKQKALAPITEEEIPFSIPENWKWVKLETVISFIGDKSNQIKESDVKKEGSFPVVSQSKEKVIGYCNNKNKVLFVNEPVLVFGDHTALIKYIDFDFVVGADGVKIMKPIVINPFYLYYALTYNLIGVSSMGGYSRHYKYIKDKLIPIPPKEEQDRIVNKLSGLIKNINVIKELIASE